jgi:hypothetical protein
VECDRSNLLRLRFGVSSTDSDRPTDASTKESRLPFEAFIAIADHGDCSRSSARYSVLPLSSFGVGMASVPQGEAVSLGPKMKKPNQSPEPILHVRDGPSLTLDVSLRK